VRDKEDKAKVTINLNFIFYLFMIKRNLGNF